MSVKLYVDLRSQPCRALAMFLKLSNIPHQLENINLFEGEHKKPEFVDKFPLQQLPGFEDGDLLLNESVAIFRYLATKYADKFEDHWYPKDKKARARVDEYIAFHHTGTRGKCIKLFVAEVLATMGGTPVDKEAVQSAAEGLTEGLDKIEMCFLKNNNYLCGNEISMADIMAVCEFSQFTVNGRDIFVGNPKLKAYFDRVKGRLSPAFDEVHGMIYSWRDSMQK